MTTTAASSSHTTGIESWLRSVGIWWDESLIHIRAGCNGCSGPALGVFAQRDIKENQLLCVIPRCAILSPRTTKLAPVLEAEKLGGGLALTIAVMYEASLGAAMVRSSGDITHQLTAVAVSSGWNRSWLVVALLLVNLSDLAQTWCHFCGRAGYFQSLPRREYLPIFWTEQELKLLEGTALEGCADDDRRDTEEDYQTHVAALLTRHKEVFPHPDLCTLDRFRTAASWVASRSFHVDAWHGDAMVPLADIFNHKASLVLLDDAWKVAEELDGTEHQHGYSHTSSMQLKNYFRDGHDRGPIAVEHAAADADGDGHTSDDKHLSAKEGRGNSDNDDGVEPLSDQQVSDYWDSDVTGDDSDVTEDQVTDDPQHGFAVGGMPVIAGSVIQRTGSSWVRDGVSLRLEIGICSLGPPDNNDLAAAVAAANGSDDHNHDHDHQHGEQKSHDHDPDHCDHRCSSECSHQSKRQRIEQLDATPQQQQQQQQQRQQWPEKRLEIIAASPISAQAEVHNTYGEHSNAELVHKYGFCLPQNPFDDVQLGPSWSWLLLEFGKSAHDGRFAEHIQWLQQHSNIMAATHQKGEPGPPTDGEEPAGAPTIMPGGRLPLATAAVIRILGATTSQLQKWESLEDVLQDVLCDRSNAAGPARSDCPPDTSTHAPPAMVAEETGTVRTVVDPCEAVDETAAEAALSEQFEDILLTTRDMSWWGRAGLELLANGIQERFKHYPAVADTATCNSSAQVVLAAQEPQGFKHGSKAASTDTLLDGSLLQASIEADQHVLQECGQHQQLPAAEQGLDVGIANEHAAAVAAAWQLRLCEKRILKQALDAISSVLAGL